MNWGHKESFRAERVREVKNQEFEKLEVREAYRVKLDTVWAEAVQGQG